MILSCSRCSTTNRIPPIPTAKIRCGKCQCVFTPAELVKAVYEPPPARQSVEPDEFELERDRVEVNMKYLVRLKGYGWEVSFDNGKTWIKTRYSDSWDRESVENDNKGWIARTIPRG